jgi:hypothetical protein
MVPVTGPAGLITLGVAMTAPIQNKPS